MPRTPAVSRSRLPFVVAVALATVLAAWLRLYGITAQVVMDDEWHAIHKLMASSYWDIFRTFGLADHSIPLTLFYKAMADVAGIAEGRLRALQIASGIALVPFAAWLAWRVTRDAPAAALTAFLVAGAPFLVLYSRFARPYAITLLLVVLCLGALWRWRNERSRRFAAWVIVTAALATWLFPLAAIYPAIGCLLVLFEDMAAPGHVRPRPSMESFKLGASVLGAMLLLLAAPLIHDGRALTGKRGGDQPNLDTYEAVLSLFWGGLPTPVLVAACALAAGGTVVLLRRDARLALYLAILATLPPAILTLVGARYGHVGMAFGRYTLPTQVILFFFCALGAMSVVRLLAQRAQEPAAWMASAALSAAYLAATPAISQVATAGPWYGHFDYHWRYRDPVILAKRRNAGYDPPDFYRKLARMAPGAAPLIVAPFIWEAPYNPLAYYATWHHQREVFGMVHDLCLAGPYVGEIPPHDRRFRFRRFIFLDDVGAVRQSGARYLLLYLEEGQHMGSVYDSRRCLAALTRLYGAPMEVDERLAVFDLRPGEPQPKLQ